VTQREVPGIDNAYLAIDTEEGMEAVWNEVMYSQRKTRLNHKERLSSILSKVIKVKHRNIVSFYDFWLDKDPENQDRLVFITEYMTSGSLLQFLKTKKRNPTAVGDKGRKVSKETPWKRWCKQILSALCYLHQKEIVHGNLTLGTIFIQHNGLVKIGAVSPDAIHQHVKTKSEEVRWMHYVAPEYATSTEITQSADIYAFGICVLEMMGLLDSDTHPVRAEAMRKACESLDAPRRRFVQMCLVEDPLKRPSASQLLQCSVLREVLPLRILSYLQLPSSDDVLEVATNGKDWNASAKSKTHK
jgi:nuclear receptor-binding protein